MTPTAPKSPLPASLNPAAATELAHSQAIAARYRCEFCGGGAAVFLQFGGPESAVGEVGQISDLDSVGINRREVVNEGVTQERSSEPS